MKFGDLVRAGSDTEVLDALRALASQLRATGSQIPVRGKSDYLGFALSGLVAYASGQITRLVSLYETGVELHAWIARNLFEVCLICEYVLLEPLRASEFAAQKASDEIAINDGFIGLSDDPNDPALEPVRERNNHIRRALSKHALPEARPWRVSLLAEETNNKADYKAFFKLYSKYVHPSAWIVLGASGETDTLVLRNVFLLQAQYYGARIQKLAEDASRSPEQNHQPPNHGNCHASQTGSP